MNSVITTPGDFKHFSSDASDHGKPHNMNLGWYLGEVLGQCLGFLGGDDWIRMRKIFDPTFTHSAAVARIDTVDSAARDYVEKLPQLAMSSSGKDATQPFTLSVAEAFTKFPYFLTARAIYGPMTGTEEDDLWRITEKRIALSPYFLGGGPYRFATTARLFDRDAIRRLREYESEWRDYNTRMVQVRGARGERAPILTYWEEHKKGNMSLPEVSLARQSRNRMLINWGLSAPSNVGRTAHAQPRRDHPCAHLVHHPCRRPRPSQIRVMRRSGRKSGRPAPIYHQD